MELNFRDKQLEKLRNEVIDLDELSDGVVLSDFTLDYFFTQLLRYLERNKAELDATPDGAYAVTDNTIDTMNNGVIFFLKLRNASTDKKEKTASPIHPFYTVFIRNNRDIRYGCMNVKQILDLFELTTEGKTESIDKLCLWFDQETDHGQNMEHYNELLNTVVKHITSSHTRTQKEGLKRGGNRNFKLTKSSKAPKSTRDFEMVTWLVIA